MVLLYKFVFMRGAKARLKMTENVFVRMERHVTPYLSTLFISERLRILFSINNNK